MAVQSTLDAASPRITAHLAPTELPADGPMLRSVWLDPATVMVGYDPQVIDEAVVVTILRSVHGEDVVVEGVRR